MQIFLLGEAVVLMRKAVANAVTSVGWPPVGETIEKLAAKHVPIYACGACSRACGVAKADLNNYGAKFRFDAYYRRLYRQALSTKLDVD